MTEEERLRRKLWIKVATAVAGSTLAIEAVTPGRWANEALKAYDKVFKEVKPSTKKAPPTTGLPQDAYCQGDKKTMTPEERQEMRDFLATELMGWKIAIFDPNDVQHYYREEQIWETPTGEIFENWRPDDPSTGQWLMVMEKMTNNNWSFSLYYFVGPKWIAKFMKVGDFRAEADNPCEAICAAAVRALKEKI